MARHRMPELGQHRPQDEDPHEAAAKRLERIVPRPAGPFTFGDLLNAMVAAAIKRNTAAPLQEDTLRLGGWVTPDTDTSREAASILRGEEARAWVAERLRRVEQALGDRAAWLLKPETLEGDTTWHDTWFEPAHHDDQHVSGEGGTAPAAIGVSLAPLTPYVAYDPTAADGVHPGFDDLALVAASF